MLILHYYLWSYGLHLLTILVNIAEWYEICYDGNDQYVHRSRELEHISNEKS